MSRLGKPKVAKFLLKIVGVEVWTETSLDFQHWLQKWQKSEIERKKPEVVTGSTSSKAL